MSHISGLSDLQDTLGRMGDCDQALKQSITKWTEYVRGEAVDLCPVRTGELRQSIHSDVEGSGHEVTGIVYTDKEYAPYVEFGTGRRGEATSSETSPDIDIEYSQFIGGQAAQPFMYPALNNNKERIMKEVQRDLQRQMK